MRRRPLMWFVLALMCFVGAALFWQWGESKRLREAASAPANANANEEVVSAASSNAVASAPFAMTSLGGLGATNFPVDAQFPLRLRNTAAPLRDLMKSDSALLLENALMDTRLGTTLPIPAHLRAQGDPGAYLVQSRGPTTDAFREALRTAGATVVSYIPNNAYLVRASSAEAASLSASPLTEAVVPFEPYFKLKGELLKMAVEEAELPQANELSVVLFPGTSETTKEALKQMGVTVIGEDRSPFGPVVKVQAPVDGLVALAGLPGVQLVDRLRPRRLATDLVRERLGISSSTNLTNYLGLTGTNVMVQVNDSGVDFRHPALFERVFGSALTDEEGHGTHVAGIIAGDGTGFPTDATPPGSDSPVVQGQFRGMAPAARIFSLQAYSREGLAVEPDWFLQEEAARTNALISNNSWNIVDGTAYDITAASYDAAVRDALPEETGSQPVLFVFAAGNDGGGNESGQGGFPDTILSPATAKNVITVGAIENLRNITNEVTICEDGDTNNCQTEVPFRLSTDSDSEVASFSSRGNVGIGVEGEFGRFKPDVVAPGTFVVSARSGQWDTNAYYNPTNYHYSTFYSQYIFPESLNRYSIFVPINAVSLRVYVSTPETEPQPLPDMPVYVKPGTFPTETDYYDVGTNSVSVPEPPLTPVGATWYYALGNPTNIPLFFNITTVIGTTNDEPFIRKGLMELNDSIADQYRYESGTSMAAPAVSGTLALLQEFFEQRLQMTVSPALLKALLINGSRSTSPDYDFQVNNLQNSQGWGLFNLPNVLPATTNFNSDAGSPLFFYDQSPTDALVTGQRFTREVKLAAGAQSQPLRFTLVWTDPPGNPVSSAKLVNDLDLVVTNLDDSAHPVVYYGNDIGSGSKFTSPWSTNSAPNIDFVNNVENVYLPSFSGTNFTVTVYGRRVNVNAVTAHPDDTAQDYALVISSGNATVDTALTVTAPGELTSRRTEVTVTTNTYETDTAFLTYLEKQHVGANTPLLGTTNGITNQWHFYVLRNAGTNSSAAYTNAVFATFLPNTLSIPRMGVNESDVENATRIEADIDLYLSTDPALTNLNPAVVSGALKSLGRGGTEQIVISNAVPGQTYYVGVKSEDMEAAEYTFFAAFSEFPISESDENGESPYMFIVPPYSIPDGSPARPGAQRAIGFSIQPWKVRRVIVTNTVTHENFGDLLGNFSHDRNFAVLNNHTFPPGDPPPLTYQFVYDDLEEGDLAYWQTTDGPGSLKNFTGEKMVGQWMLTMLDDALTQTGRMDNVRLRLERSYDTNLTDGIVRTIGGNRWYYDVIEVPPDATNLTISVGIETATPLPVELYLRHGDFPSRTIYDLKKIINPPGDKASITSYDLPPLAPGKYYFGLFNPNNAAQTVRIIVSIGLGVDGRDTRTLTATNSVPLLDDAVTYATQHVEDDRRIASLDVGLVVEHPRVSDLVFHLVSPTGKRILLSENRGMSTPDGFGSLNIFTNVFPTQTAGGFQADTNTLNVGAQRGTLVVDYDFQNIPDEMRIYYDDALIYDTRSVNGSNTFSVDFGPGTNDFLTITMNEGNNSDTNTIWAYTATVISSTPTYLVFTEDTDKTTTPIKFGTPPFGGVSATNGAVVFEDGFENGSPGNQPAGSGYFSGGWFLVTNDVDLLATGIFGSTAYEGNQYIDINGWDPGAIRTNITLNVGQDYRLDFAFARNPDSVAVGILPRAQVALGSNDLATIVANGNSQWTNLNWQSTSIVFTAESPGPLKITSLTTGARGVLFDGFKISAVPKLDRYFLPEESLDDLAGDSAKGDWTLEVWDNRVGAAVAPRIVNWELRFIYETVVQLPIRLQHWVSVTNTLETEGILYYVVDVPPWAMASSNELVSATAPVNVLYGQPVPPVDGDLEIISNSMGDTNWLDTTTPTAPELQPGQRYYLGLQNTNTNSVTVVMQVEFNVTALTNGVPYDSTLGTNQLGGFARYFSYDVSSNASAVTFELLNLSGNVNLVARKGTPLPSGGDYDYGSFYADKTDEYIAVYTNANYCPIPLTPGRWFLGVLVADSAPVDYTILATEYTNELNFVTLTNAEPYTNSNSGNGLIEDNYRYIVTQSVARLQCEVLDPTADVTLLLSKGLLPPTFSQFDYLSANPGTSDEFVLVLSNSVPVQVGPGEWFLTVANASGQPADYSVLVTQWPVAGTPTNVVPPHLENGEFCWSWNSLPGAKYVVQGKVSLSETNWVNLSGTITATDYVTSYCVALPSPFHFFRVIEGVAPDPGSAAQIAITSITRDTNGVTLTWQAPPTFQFLVEWADDLSGPWTTLPTVITSTDGTFTYTDDGTQTAPLGPTRFYRFIVLP